MKLCTALMLAVAAVHATSTQEPPTAKNLEKCTENGKKLCDALSYLDANDAKEIIEDLETKFLLRQNKDELEALKKIVAINNEESKTLFKCLQMTTRADKDGGTFLSVENRRLFISHYDVSWNQASGLCEEMHMMQVTFEDNQELEAARDLLRHIENDTKYWCAASDETDALGQFKWRDGTPVPNDMSITTSTQNIGQKMCVYVTSTRGLASYVCDHALYAMCEVPEELLRCF